MYDSWCRSIAACDTATWDRPVILQIDNGSPFYNVPTIYRVLRCSALWYWDIMDQIRPYSSWKLRSLYYSGDLIYPESTDWFEMCLSRYIARLWNVRRDEICNRKQKQLIHTSKVMNKALLYCHEVIPGLHRRQYIIVGDICPYIGRNALLDRSHISKISPNLDETDILVRAHSPSSIIPYQSHWPSLCKKEGGIRRDHIAHKNTIELFKQKANWSHDDFLSETASS